MEDKTILICKDCGSSDVSVKIWVNVNKVCKNLPITNYQDTEEDAYCNSCNSEQKYLSENEFSMEKK
ncbi:MAG: hypothetical protein Unbinned3849contig1000_33 [Prokaryotic dsDNA virus sp.]|nr:MAG: hypothetical protein Unbinned3849contig1000_33 [Prokaryotic dsDNA virus sp.]